MQHATIAPINRAHAVFEGLLMALTATSDEQAQRAAGLVCDIYNQCPLLKEADLETLKDAAALIYQYED